MILVVEHGLEPDGAARRVDLVVDQRKRAGRKHPLAVGGERDRLGRAGGERGLDIRQLVFRRGEDHRDRLDLGDGHDAGLRRGIDDIADIDLPEPDDTGDRRLDGGVIELGLRVLDQRRVGLNLRRQLRDGGALRIGLLPGREFAELGKALQVEVGVGKVGFVLGLLGLGLIEGGLERPRIDLDQRVAFLDELAFLERDPVDLTVDAGADHDGVEALHGAEAGQIDRKIGLFDRGSPHRDGGTGRRALLGFSLRLMILALEALPAQITQRSDRYDQQSPTDGARPRHGCSWIEGSSQHCRYNVRALALYKH